MAPSKTDGKQNNQSKTSDNNIIMGGGILFLFLGLFVIGAVGYIAMHNPSMDLVFAHLGGLGIIGFLGDLTGIIAKKKGYSYWKVFGFGLFLPICVGVITVLMSEPFSCGGSPSLGAALLILVIYSFVKRRDVEIHTEAK